MTTDLVTVEVWLKIDADGDVAVALDQEACAEKWLEDYSDVGQAMRMVRVTLNVPKPRIVEISATIPDEPADAIVKVA